MDEEIEISFKPLFEGWFRISGNEIPQEETQDHQQDGIQ